MSRFTDDLFGARTPLRMSLRRRALLGILALCTVSCSETDPAEGPADVRPDSETTDAGETDTPSADGGLDETTDEDVPDEPEDTALSDTTDAASNDTLDTSSDAGADADDGSSSDAGEPDSPDSGPLDLAVIISSGPLDGSDQAAGWVEFASVDADSFTCQLDDGAPWACQSPALVVPTNVGGHSVSVQAHASAGESGAPTVYEWTTVSVMRGAHSELTSVPRVPGAVNPAQEPGWLGMFRINCRLANTSYDDPFRYPGLADGGSLNQFFGNLAANAETTWSSLHEQPESSCQGGVLNSSIYMVPAMLAPRYTLPPGCDDDDPDDPDCDDSGFVAERVLDGDEPAWDVVTPVVGNDADGAHEVFYYSAEVDDLSSVVIAPPGLRMLSGDETIAALDDSQSLSVVRYHCRSWGSDNVIDGSERVQTTIPSCQVGNRVLIDVFFPGCWDGLQLESDNQRDHVAHAIDVGGASVCPSSHPIPIVRPSIHLQYPIRHSNIDPATGLTDGWRLASDAYSVTDELAGGLSGHAAWFNGWHPEVMGAFLDDVIAAGRDAHNGNVGNGFILSDVTSGSELIPAIIDEGRGASR